MDRTDISRIGVALSLMALALGCSSLSGPVDDVSEPCDLAGTLVIGGGSMADENEAFWGRMIELAGERGIAVLPTASGVPYESGPGTVQECFQAHGGRAWMIDVTTQTPANAESEALAASIERSGGVFFTGGVQSRIAATLIREDASRTPVLDAVWRVLNQGGVVGGTSAGAAMQCNPMINGGSSADSLLTGVDPTGDTGVGLEPGLGFFPWGLIGQHHIQRGRVGRMIIALQESGLRFGYGIDENSAIEVNRSEAIAEVLCGTVIALDVEGLEGGPGQGVSGVRFHLLRAGDQIDLRTGTPLPCDQIIEGDPDSPASTVHLTSDDVWRRGELSAALESMAADTAPHRVVLEDERFRIHLIPGQEMAHHGSLGEDHNTVVNGMITVELLGEEAVEQR
jgi:cyanophycinase